MIATEHRLALPAGYQLGKYRFKGVLGAGGFGITYLADDHTLGRRVAIKELLPNEIATRLDGTTVIAKTKSEEGNLAWARERFLEEGRALAACEHPNVVHVYEMIEANGTAYMVTKYEDGRSLAEWLTNLGHRPNEAELRGLLEPLLSGLDKVHRAGFLHRDIKPENIYITDDGRPLLLDFGSARQAVTGSKLLTSIVTIGYAPFEQYYEDGKQGAWSDIYALAGVMYRGIHGEKPPEATRRIKNDTCVTLAKKYAGQYSAQFLNAIDKALAVEHSQRPQSVMIWRGLLGKGTVAQAEVLAVSPHEAWMERLRHLAAILFDHPRATASVAAVGVLLCGFAIWKAVSPTPTPGPIYVEPKPGPIAEVTPPPGFKSDNTLPGPTNIGTPTPSTPPPFIAGPTPSRGSGGENWIPSFTPGPAAGPIVDPKLVGTWTAKVTGPSGFVVMRWEQLEDGRYTLSRAGSTIDTGTLSSQGGVMHQISAVTHMSFETPYEFKSTKLQTTGPNDAGTVLWTRVAGSTGSKSGNTSSRSKGSSGEGSSRSGSGSGGTDWRQFIPRNAPSHGIPHLPF